MRLSIPAAIQDIETMLVLVLAVVLAAAVLAFCRQAAMTFDQFRRWLAARRRARRLAREQGQLIPAPRTPKHASGPQPALRLRDLLAEDPATDLEEYLYREGRQ